MYRRLKMTTTQRIRTTRSSRLLAAAVIDRDLNVCIHVLCVPYGLCLGDIRNFRDAVDGKGRQGLV